MIYVLPFSRNKDRQNFDELFDTVNNQLHYLQTQWLFSLRFVGFAKL
jgi:hypothetical protein